VIDKGLLATLAVAAIVVSVLDRWLRRCGAAKDPMSALASTPLIVGVAAARLTAVVLDNPATLARPFDLLLIRGGMEFWAGVAGALAAIWWAARKRSFTAVDRIAEIAPFALFAYAVHEAGCILRDGCFGPASPAGLRPAGLGQRQVPVGILVGVAAASLATLVWRWSRRRSPAVVTTLALTGLAGIRSIAGFALPKLAEGPTRPHLESLLALGIGILGSIAGCRRGRGRVRPSNISSEPGTPDWSVTDRSTVHDSSSDSM